MLRRSAAGNIRYALAAAGVPRAQRSARASTNCWHWSASTGRSATARRAALSGGEQQRLALARALARDPAMLFLDEPTASLDPAATKAIEDIIRAVAARGVKVVMSTHDLGEAKRSRRRGRAAASRPHDRSGPGRRRSSRNRAREEARTFVAGELLV